MWYNELMFSNWVIRNWKVALLVFLIFIILTVWITNTSEHWLSKFILTYFDNWSIALSAGVMLVLAITAFWTIADNRRMRVEEAHRLALLRIRDWAEMISNALGTPTKEILFEEKKSEETLKIQPGMSKTFGILYDAERLEGTLNDRVKDAVILLQKYNVRLMGKEQIEEWKGQLKLQEEIIPIKSLEEMRDSIIELLTALSDVIKSATKELVPKR